MESKINCSPDNQSRDRVAKVIVAIRIGSKLHLLFSRKRVFNRPESHDRLELLGGHLDNDDPLQGAIRELREEELSGLLGGKLQDKHLIERIMVDGIEHHIYSMEISCEEHKQLRHNARESLGFELIAFSEMWNTATLSRLTEKTLKILAAFMDAGKRKCCGDSKLG
jgi:hypothetical protein